MATVRGRTKGYPRGKADWDGKRLVTTYEDMFELVADNEQEGPRTVIESLGIRVGEPFFDDEFAFAKTVGPAARNPEARLEWLVPVFYTSQFPLEDADEVLAETPPDQRRLKRRWTAETMNELFTHDAIDTDKPFVSSSGEVIEATHDIKFPVLTVERYKETFDPSEILNYANHSNEDTFYGAPAKTALVTAIEAEEDAKEVFQGVLYDRVRYVVAFKIPITEQNKGWLMRVADMGTQHRDPDNPDEFIPYLSKESSADGVKSHIRGPLDGDGNRLPEGSPLVFLEFNEFKTATLANLLIGPND